MTYHEILRLVVVSCTGVFVILCGALIWRWHLEPNKFDLRDLFMTTGRDKKAHVSRIALAELVSLVATTSAYLGAMAAKPDIFTEATLAYGGLWAVRGGFSTYVKSRGK
jgi:hypothetical protein